MLIDVEIKGTEPLLQHDSFGKEEQTKKGHVYDPETESERSLIKDEKGTICQRASHLEGCMIKSAADFKFTGRRTYKDAFKAGIRVRPELITHLTPDWRVDSRRVVIGRSSIIRSRPRFDNWGLKFKIECNDDRIQPLVIKDVLANAGKYIGIGDFRPRYGLFEITKFEVDGTDNL